MISFQDILQHLRKTEHGAEALTAMTVSHLERGERGEQLAAQFLELSGYRIVVRNFITPIGYSRRGRPVSGEIDIIAYDESVMPFTLAFIEVKTRTSSEIAAPESAVDQRKRRRIERAARVYRRLLAIEDEPYRYDVVSVVTAPNEAPRLALLRGYFRDTMADR